MYQKLKHVEKNSFHVELKLVNVANIDALALLLKEVKGNAFNVTDFKKTMGKVLAHGLSTFSLIEVEGMPVGFIDIVDWSDTLRCDIYRREQDNVEVPKCLQSLFQRSSGFKEISFIFISKQFRHCGYAREIVENLLKDGGNWIARIKYANVASIRLFSGIGFKDYHQPADEEFYKLYSFHIFRYYGKGFWNAKKAVVFGYLNMAKKLIFKD